MPPLIVLLSSPPPRPTTNPYNVMLARHLEEQTDVDLRYFSWRQALRGGFDVFHAHWPEILVDGRTPLRKLTRQVLSLTFFTLLWARRTAVVRTVHNVALPEGISRREVALLRMFERITTLRITLNPTTPTPPHAPVVLIPHGHYRDWYAARARRSAVPDQLAYVGNVRRYKSLDVLLDAFAQTRGSADSLRLTVSGNPTSDGQGAAVLAAAADDDRITCTLRFLDDDEFVAAITAAELVVLPYREMHNSGGVLAALSLDRPVLVPDNEVNRLLADEAGADWVLMFAPPLRGSDLVSAVARARRRRPGRPDLSAREWGPTVRAHVAAYRQAVRLRRGRDVT